MSKYHDNECIKNGKKMFAFSILHFAFFVIAMALLSTMVTALSLLNMTTLNVVESDTFAAWASSPSNVTSTTVNRTNTANISAPPSAPLELPIPPLASVIVTDALDSLDDARNAILSNDTEQALFHIELARSSLMTLILNESTISAAANATTAANSTGTLGENASNLEE